MFGLILSSVEDFAIFRNCFGCPLIDTMVLGGHLMERKKTI